MDQFKTGSDAFTYRQGHATEPAKFPYKQPEPSKTYSVSSGTVTPPAKTTIKLDLEKSVAASKAATEAAKQER